MEQLVVDGQHVVRWSGSGPTVLMLHAGVTDARAWYATAELLGARHRCVAYDRRGHGRTPPSRAPYSEAADLLTVMDAIADDPVWLVASSRGGRPALDVALSAPGRVAGLVLIAPSVAGAPEPDLDPDTERLDTLIEAATDAGDLAEANRLEAQLWLDGPGSVEGRVPDPARALFLEMNATVLAHDPLDLAEPGRPDTWHQLAGLQLPATVVWGELDVPCLVDRSRLLVELLPQAAGHPVENAAHLPYLEQPGPVAALIAAAVAG